jgi:hypothetical protein
MIRLFLKKKKKKKKKKKRWRPLRSNYIALRKAYVMHLNF